MQDVSDKYILLEETEKQALRKALIEDRQRFCCFVAMLRPVVVSSVWEKREVLENPQRTTESLHFIVSLLLFSSLRLHTLTYSMSMPSLKCFL